MINKQKNEASTKINNNSLSANAKDHSYDWNVNGDKEKKLGNYNKAINSYIKAFETVNPNGAKYIVAKISSCYRKINRPQSALNFYNQARNLYGDYVVDYVVMTTIAGAYGDLKKWSEALNYANYACELNDGVVDKYIEAVLNRITYNMNKSNKYN